jgi:hypothetical protein
LLACGFHARVAVADLDPHGIPGPISGRRDALEAVGRLKRHVDRPPVAQISAPKVAALLEEAETDVLAFYAFPAEHWPKVRFDESA